MYSFTEKIFYQLNKKKRYAIMLSFVRMYDFCKVAIYHAIYQEQHCCCGPEEIAIELSTLLLAAINIKAKKDFKNR